jgi:hypothetical protein
MNNLSDVVRQRYEGTPCKDCEGVYPYECYDLDHVEPEDKAFTIQKLRKWKDTPENRLILWRELAKTQWVCRNCHATRTLKARVEGRIKSGRPKGSKDRQPRKGKGQ